MSLFEQKYEEWLQMDIAKERNPRRGLHAVCLDLTRRLS